MSASSMDRATARSKGDGEHAKGRLPSVEQALCKACGLCASICPGAILELQGEGLRVRTDRPLPCIGCGQCVVICKTGALTHPAAPAERLAPATERPFGDEALLDFLRTRRSVRVFRDEPVERATIERVLEIAATAPMGVGSHTTEVTVVDGRSSLDHVREVMYETYGKLVQGMSSPIGRMVIRRRVGRDLFPVMVEHVVPVARLAADLRAEGRDKLTYGAPALLLLHADPKETAAEVNAHIVGTYVLLAAHSLGLGATWLDIVSPIFNRRDDLRRFVGIPEAQKVFVSVILGHPKVRYRRTLTRPLRRVRFVS